MNLEKMYILLTSYDKAIFVAKKCRKANKEYLAIYEKARKELADRILRMEY